jgi:hypothetical protein
LFNRKEPAILAGQISQNGFGNQRTAFVETLGAASRLVSGAF